MNNWTTDIITCTKCKSPFLPGMVFKSKSHSHMNMIISYVSYGIHPTIIDWSLIDRKAYDDFLESKGITGNCTFPYVCCGECTHQSMRQRIKKYNLELDHIEDMKIYRNDDCEFSAVLSDEVRNKYDEKWKAKE